MSSKDGRVRWGIISTANIGMEKVTPGIQRSPHSVVTAIASRDLGRAKAAAKQLGIAKAYGSYEELLADPEIDAVYNPLPNHLHVPLTVQAAKAGKHVLCEKPLALSVADARAMVEACREAGVVMGTNHHLRNAASHGAIRAAIKAGRIGKPLSARVFHAVYLPPHLQGWRITKPEAGGGVILDITVHDIDTLRFILDDNPVEVTALAQSGGMAAGGLEDAAMSVFRFKSGLIAQTHDGFTTKHAGTGIEIHGTEGSLFGRDVMTQKPIGTVTLRTEKGEEELPLAPENLYVRGLRAFHDAMRGKGAPAATGEDGVWSLAAGVATQEAARTGRVVKIDPGL